MRHSPLPLSSPPTRPAPRSSTKTTLSGFPRPFHSLKPCVGAVIGQFTQTNLHQQMIQHRWMQNTGSTISLCRGLRGEILFSYFSKTSLLPCVVGKTDLLVQGLDQNVWMLRACKKPHTHNFLPPPMLNISGLNIHQHEKWCDNSIIQVCHSKIVVI